MSHSADRNLLFGILALQNNFISREQLLTGFNAWVVEKEKALGTILQDQGALAAERRQLLEALVQEHLKQHAGDPQQSLAAVPVSSRLKEKIKSLCHPDLEASLAQLRTDSEPDPDATRSPSVGEASTIGQRFRILRPHAEGGLGKVSVALDEELNREVALKEIKEQHADDPSSRGRFVLEAEITGGLEHPGIVPVYGLGNYADGRPFYAMRFIRGDSLKDAIVRFHGCSTRRDGIQTDVQASDVSNEPDFQSLEFRQLLGRFVDVCNAIAYAHSRGVLHRDLKPGNIMLGQYGETLIVDWGLAKATLAKCNMPRNTNEGRDSDHPADASPWPNATRSGSPLAETPLIPSNTDYEETVAGQPVGTPAFMSPEQACGRLDLVGPASDIYCLGATLFAVLTGQPPLKDLPTSEILDRIAKGEIPTPRQLLGASVPVPLDAISQKAMALAPPDRYATPLALAKDIERWLADEPVSAYREPWNKRLGRWRRRHHTLVTAASLVLATVLVGGIAGFGVIERQTIRTQTLAKVDALQDADAGVVSALLADLSESDASAFARAKLHDRWAQSSLTDRQRLRIGLSLAADDEIRHQLLDLAASAQDPREVLLVRDSLMPHAAQVKAELWNRSQEPTLSRGKRLRLLAILAAVDPGSSNWPSSADLVVNELLVANPLHLGVWRQAFAPIRKILTASLEKAFHDSPTERRQLATAFLVDYLADQPSVLLRLLLDADAQQFQAIFPALMSGDRPADSVTSALLAALEEKKLPTKQVILKKAERIAATDASVKVATGQSMTAKVFEITLNRGITYEVVMASSDFDPFVLVRDGAGNELAADDSGDGLNSALILTPTRTETHQIYAAAQGRQPSGHFILTVIERLNTTPKKLDLSSRQANAAVALLRSNPTDRIWSYLEHSADPSIRSQLIHRLAAQGVEAEVLVERFDAEKATSARCALLLSLGELAPDTLLANKGGGWKSLEKSLFGKLSEAYQSDPDPGIHAAVAWLLGRWGQQAAIRDADRQHSKKTDELPSRVVNCEVPIWWVNSQQLTMIGLPGPITFQMGSPRSEMDRQLDEEQHRRRINRSFALAAHPITVAQFRRFRKSHHCLAIHAPTDDCPVHGVTWFDAAAYCNWLSEQDGIPMEQWCYEEDVQKQTVRAKEGHLRLSGYRLPTEAEMEYACRAGAFSARYFGDQEALLEKYAWYVNNLQDRSFAVGLLKPNDLGFFDMHGNVWNWCYDAYAPYPVNKDDAAIEDVEEPAMLDTPIQRLLRGGSFLIPARLIRSACRYKNSPDSVHRDFGFRPARTLRSFASNFSKD